jgi:hypothetical protein
MKDRTTYIDENLLVSLSSAMTDEMVRIFQRKLYIRAKQRKESAQGVTPTPIQYICQRQRAVRLGKVCSFENPCESSMKNSIGKPYEGKLHVRFDEGGTDSLTNFIIFVEKKNYE